MCPELTPSRLPSTNGGLVGGVSSSRRVRCTRKQHIFHPWDVQLPPSLQAVERSGHRFPSPLELVDRGCHQSMAVVQVSFEELSPLLDMATSTPQLRTRYIDGPCDSEEDPPTGFQWYQRPIGVLFGCLRFEHSFKCFVHSAADFPIR